MRITVLLLIFCFFASPALASTTDFIADGDITVEA